MDLATIVGFVGGLTLVVGAMSLAGPLGTFWDLTSILIVLGGSVFFNAHENAYEVIHRSYEGYS